MQRFITFFPDVMSHLALPPWCDRVDQAELLCLTAAVDGAVDGANITNDRAHTHTAYVRTLLRFIVL